MSYLIKDTTRDERLNLAKNALAMTVGSDQLPSRRTVKLVNEYVNGNMELIDVKKKIIEEYKKV